MSTKLSQDISRADLHANCKTYTEFINTFVTLVGLVARIIMQARYKNALIEILLVQFAANPTPMPATPHRPH